MIKIESGLYQHQDFSLKINLNVSAGKFIVVLGPSGAGKSTLLNIIAGFESLKTGSIYIEGQNVTSVSPAERPVSMVFQDFNTFDHLSVWNNVALGILPSLALDEAQKQKVESAISKVGLVGLSNRKPSELSGGERQRIALARVLVRKKPILLLDEPFAALDPALRKDMLDLVCELQHEQNLTVLLVTHQPEDARIADGVIFVSDGKVTDAVPVREFSKSKDSAILNYLGRSR